MEAEDKKNNSQDSEKKGFTNQEIQELEADRQVPESWNMIHLLREGNYWHAYEWSVWLINEVMHAEIKRRHPEDEHVVMKPVRKYAKNIDGEYVFVGCQEKSFEKYMPKELQMDYLLVDNLRIDIPIEMPAELGELSYERLHKMYLEWKESVPLSKDKTSNKVQNMRNGKLSVEDGSTNNGLMAILTKVLSFQLAKHTPYQAQEFIGELQDEILAHF